MDSRTSRLIVPVLFFSLAIAMSSVAGPGFRAMLLRDAEECSGIAIPLAWEQEIGEAVTGKINGKRDGDKLTIKHEKFDDSVTLTKDAHKACKVKDTNEEVCIEVFNAKAPDAGIRTNADISTVKKTEVPLNSRFYGHFKAFILTPCEKVTILQIRDVTQTVQVNDGEKTIDKKATTNGFVVDFPPLPEATVPGKGHIRSDIPGTFVLPDSELPAAGMVTTVTKADFLTFFKVDKKDLAVVSWNVQFTLVETPGGRTFSQTFGDPAIICQGTADFDKFMGKDFLIPAIKKFQQERNEKK